MESSFFANSITIEGNVLFVSDAHLGVASNVSSAQREELLVQLLTEKQNDIQHLFLLGDIFDYWFEYKDVVPKGYIRLFNILYELNKKGVQIYFFTGNHDMWVRDYFKQQFGCQVFYTQQAFVINGKRCLIGHGDGIGGKQPRYLLIKRIFAFEPNRKLYSMLHPRQSFAIARYFSKTSRASHDESVFVFKEEQEHQVQFARQVLQNEQVDYFIYGHRHIPIEYRLTDASLLINTGDWLYNFSYVTFMQQESPALNFFKQEI